MENEMTVDMQQFPEISAEKFKLADKRDLSHDKKLETKPVGYFKGAFKRFCKNKGSVVAAVIIGILLLFSIIAPFCTPYTVSFNDSNFGSCLPVNNLFKNTSFWDGCRKMSVNKEAFTKYLAMGEETGHLAVKNEKYTYNDHNDLYEFRLDSYYSLGCVYMNISEELYHQIQDYQNEYDVQVLYPTVAKRDRPQAIQDQRDANYYYKTRGTSKIETVYDKDGKVIPVYKSHDIGEEADDDYYSKRIPSDRQNGEEFEYAIPNDAGYEVRANYYEYFVFKHKVIDKDGITKPHFLFGSTAQGKDILTNLAMGARFSFLFAIAVAVVNMIVGVIYGSIEGYYGGKIDLVMERVSDILSAIPSTVVIVLLKLHLGASGQMVVLFVAFFAIGWIGMAGTTRMQFYRFKNQEYVLAARTLGAKDPRIMFKHIFPNAIGTLVTSCALIIPGMIYSEVNLSYLGIINLSTGNLSSVGTMLAQGQSSLMDFPHIIAFPSVFLALLMLSFNLFGNGLRDAFNPSLRGTEG